MHEPKKYLESKRPNLYFLCGEVYRDSNEMTAEEKHAIPAPHLPLRTLPERISR